MKLGATATSPGVTARWHSTGDGRAALYDRDRTVCGTVYLYAGMWVAARNRPGEYSGSDHTHRYQAKRAVEAAVSQALREAEQ